MKRSKVLRFASLVCAAALALAALAGCASNQNNEEAQKQAQNRQYMTQVNQIMDSLDGQLEGFVDAVSRQDVVTMRTQADTALKSIDELNNLEVPDDMKDIQSDYVDGCNSLKDALNEYVQLYTDISRATEAQPFDYNTYDQRLSEIQDTYNEGIEKLKAGDEAAASKS